MELGATGKRPEVRDWAGARGQASGSHKATGAPNGRRLLWVHWQRSRKAQSPL